MIFNIMRNVIIKEEVYEKLSQIKGKKSFSDIIGEIIEDAVETKRKNIRSAFASLKEAEIKEFERIIEEVRRGAKGRLF